MRKIIFAFFICVMQTGFSQSYDDEVITKACDCIYNSKSDSIDAVINSCLLKALIHSLKNDGITEKDLLPDKQYGDPNTEQSSFFMKYLEMIYKNCWATQLLVERKQERYYKASGSEAANRYYKEGIDNESGEKTDQTVLSFEKALTYDSLFVPAIDKLALLYEKKEKEQALRYYLKSLRIFPEGYTALMGLGEHYISGENYQQALSVYSRIIKYYPKKPTGYFGLGRISFLNQDYPSTIRLMMHAYSICRKEDSDCTDDCKHYLQITYLRMKAMGQETEFLKIAGEFIPPVYPPEEFYKLQSTEPENEIDCRLMEPQILACTDYVLSTAVNAADTNRVYALNTIKKWMRRTPYYIYHVGKNVSGILDKEGEVLSVFITAMVKFSIEHPEQGNDQGAVAWYAWNTILDYIGNKKYNLPLTGEIKKMMKARKEGKLKKLIE